jgi:uncharacterized protein (DUF3084 family)
MLNKRHQQELAEIKALTRDLTGRVEKILKELQRIRENQDALLARDQGLAAAPPAGEAKRARRAKSADSGGARKRGGAGGRKKRRPPEPAARPSADEE